jgi:hypothetical protein
MIHPDTCIRYIDETIGHGVFATTAIPKGTILWVMDPLDRCFTADQLASMDAVKREVILNHSFRNNKGEFVLCWDHTRYVNHSFSPNSYPTAYGLEIAIRDIAANEQITNDYGFLNIIEPFEPVNEGVGRGIVTPNDLPSLYQEWDKTITEIIPELFRQNQPLRPLIKDSLWQELEEVANGNSRLRSVLELWFKEL